jgi:nucleoside 2-deoxyribosyltransferase
VKPYSQNIEEARRVAALEASAVQEAEALVLIADQKGVGLFVELGIAIGQGKAVYVLTSAPEQTIFYYHPKVKLFKTKNELVLHLVPRDD